MTVNWLHLGWDYFVTLNKPNYYIHRVGRCYHSVNNNNLQTVPEQWNTMIIPFVNTQSLKVLTTKKFPWAVGEKGKITNSFASWNRKENMTLASQDVLPTASLGLWMWCTFFCITSFFFFKWHLLMDRGWRDWLIVKRLLLSLGKSSSQWGSPGLASHTSARPHIAFVLVSGWTGLGSPSLIDGKQNICLVDPGRS